MPQKRRQSGGFSGIPPQAITVVLVIFVLGWLVSLGAAIFKPGYTAPTGLNETMIALVTAFFVAQQRLTRGQGDDEEDEEEEPPPPRKRSAGPQRRAVETKGSADTLSNEDDE